MNPLVTQRLGGDDMEVEEFLEELLHRINNWLEIGPLDKVNPGESIDEIRRNVRLPPPLEGEGLKGVLEGIDQFLKHSVKTHHPNFLNPLWGGFSPAAFAGEVISTLAQTSMYTYELAPIATLIEKSLIDRMREMIGFSTGSGVLTTGGSNGNMLGLLCARQRHSPATLNKGISGLNYSVFVSQESHYSTRMAVNALGIGYDNLVKVGCDDSGRMSPERLLEEIDISIREGQTPLCVIATSGTTVRGSFDDLKSIADIAHSNDMWLHVDAAWGGTSLFSTKYSYLMDGIDLADSVCWDAHKMMGIPLICSAFIVKHEKILRQACSHGSVAHYLLHPEAAAIDLGHISLQCGRRNDALKLWLAWKEKGDAGWGRMVDSYMELADYLELQIAQESNLEMASTRMWTNVCFQFVPDNYHGDISALNSQIRSELLADGSFMVSKSNIGEKVVLRAVISNSGITRETLDAFLAKVIEIGNDIVSEVSK